MTPEKQPKERIDAVATHLARVTQEPGVVREVDDAELLDLARQGILHSYEKTDTSSAIVAGRKTPAKWVAPKKGAEIVAPPDAITDPAANAGEGDKKKGE